jgi:hypothetical protein
MAKAPAGHGQCSEKRQGERRQAVIDVLIWSDIV